MITITAVEAQNRFGQLLDTAQREPVAITRHGRPVAMLMAVEEFEARRPDGVAARAARQAVAAFRGSGKGTTVEQLLADRRAETLHEPAVPYAVRRVPAKDNPRKGRA